MRIDRKWIKDRFTSTESVGKVYGNAPSSGDPGYHTMNETYITNKVLILQGFREFMTVKPFIQQTHVYTQGHGLAYPSCVLGEGEKGKSADLGEVRSTQSVLITSALINSEAIFGIVNE